MSRCLHLKSLYLPGYIDQQMKYQTTLARSEFLKPLHKTENGASGVETGPTVLSTIFRVGIMGLWRVGMSPPWDHFVRNLFDREELNGKFHIRHYSVAPSSWWILSIHIFFHIIIHICSHYYSLQLKGEPKCFTIVGPGNRNLRPKRSK